MNLSTIYISEVNGQFECIALYLQLALSHRFSAGQLLKGYFEHTIFEESFTFWLSAPCGIGNVRVRPALSAVNILSIVFVDVISVGFDA